MKPLNILHILPFVLVLMTRSFRVDGSWSLWEHGKEIITDEIDLLVGSDIKTITKTKDNVRGPLRGVEGRLKSNVNVEYAASKIEGNTERFIKKNKRSRKFELSIIDEGGNGKYSKGERVDITARKVAGKTFKRWKVINGLNNIIEDRKSSTTILTMPEKNVKIRAKYVDREFRLTVIKGDEVKHNYGTYPVGNVVRIDAAPQSDNTLFLRWSVNKGPSLVIKNPYSEETSLTMPSKDVTVKALYNTQTEVKFELVVIAGNGIGTYPEGTLVNITANDPPLGSNFQWWIVTKGKNDDIITNPSLKMTTLRMPNESVRVQAKYSDPKFKLHVIEGSGGGLYDPGAVVSIIADEPPTGFKFSMWDIKKGPLDIIADTTSEATILTMPKNMDVEIMAEYTFDITTNFTLPVYNITVIKGVINGAVINGVQNGDDGGSYEPGTTIEFNTNKPPTGSIFKWLIVSGPHDIIDDPESLETTLKMPERNVVVKAAYTYNHGFIPRFVLTVRKGLGEGTFKTESIVTIMAENPPQGSKFARWEVIKGFGMIADPSSRITTVFMYESGVEVRALFLQIT